MSTYMNLISFVSMGLITFIGISSFPLLGKLEDRKINVLRFFNILSIDQINAIIVKAESYRRDI